jgi:hypothetical protein
MSDHDTLPEYDLDDWETDEEPLPKRPRRRLVTPVSATLAGALVAALGFIGGVQVQKGQEDGGSTTSPAALATSGAGRGSFPRGGAGGPGAAQSNATVGSVANKKGSTLYVKDSDGNTIRVKTTSHSKINRTAKTTAGAIHPGDTVIVQGTTSKNGTITATQINATSSSATSGLASLFGGGGFGGGGAGQGPGGGALQQSPGGG